MTNGQAREAARTLLEVMPLVMRTVAAELRAAGELPAPAHFPLLHMLSEQPRTLSSLAAFRGVSLPSMSSSVATLVGKGWVRRVTPGADRRVVMLEVTPGGRAALDRVARCAERHIAAVLSPLDESARRRLESGLDVMREAFAAPPQLATGRARQGRRRRQAR
jgi:DNA-binding MarR family transcriptional regulator